MHLKRYFVEGLAHASNLIGADGEAAVVDPKRDVDDYISDAEDLGLRVQNVTGGMGAYQETRCADWQAADLVFNPLI